MFTLQSIPQLLSLRKPIDAYPGEISFLIPREKRIKISCEPYLYFCQSSRARRGFAWLSAALVGASIYSSDNLIYSAQIRLTWLKTIYLHGSIYGVLRSSPQIL